MIEKIKTLILLILVGTSLLLSLSLWSGVKQYDPLPAWVMKGATDQVTQNPIEKPVVQTIETEKLLSALLKPEKMVKHQDSISRQYFVNDNSYANMAWNNTDNILKSVDKVTLKKVTLKEYNDVKNDGSYEFIFAGSYPLNLVYPDWKSEKIADTLKVDRVMVSTTDNPVVYLRSLNYETVYKVETSDEWTATGFTVFSGEDSRDGWLVYDAGDNQNIMSGVYLPKNFVANYGDKFPEIYLTSEIQDKKKWVSLFFTNTSLAREVSLSNNQFYYSLGKTSLAINYNEKPHLEYSYALLKQDEVFKPYYDQFLNSNDFISKHNYTKTPDFESDVRLHRTWKKSGKSTFIYNTYTSDLDYNILIQSDFSAYRVEHQGGKIIDMIRQTWITGRKYTIPKISTEPIDAIKRLTSDKWNFNPNINVYAVETIANFNKYLEKGYKISDVSLVYYVEHELTESLFATPHWAVSLTNGYGETLRFYINALTSNIPNKNGLIVE